MTVQEEINNINEDSKIDIPTNNSKKIWYSTNSRTTTKLTGETINDIISLKKTIIKLPIIKMKPLVILCLLAKAIISKKYIVRRMYTNQTI